MALLRWSAERRARPAGRAPRLARHGTSRAETRDTEDLRLSALRSPLMGWMEQRKSKTRARKRAAGTKKTALFDIVNRNCAATRPVPAERAARCPSTLVGPLRLHRGVSRAAGERDAVERHALDAAPEQLRLFGGDGAGVDAHPRDLRREAPIFDLRTAVHHHLEAVR